MASDTAPIEVLLRQAQDGDGRALGALLEHYGPYLTLLARVQAYQAELEAGRRPNHGAFLARHPDVADALAGCLRAFDFVHGAVPGSTRPGAEPGTTPAPGRVLGDYRIIREIGRGGMGVVDEAEQVSLGRRVALKVLPAASAPDGRALGRFRHEALAAAGLHHPHIVPVHAVGSEGDAHFFAMQFIEGASLAAVLRGLRKQAGLEPALLAGTPALPATTAETDPPGADTDPPAGARPPDPAPPAAASLPGLSPRSPGYYREAARLARQAALALQHAHELGVVHRDVKPGNLLLDRTGELWVADFGLAKLPGSDLTGAGDVLGTLRYMSPEQALGKAAPIDGRTDVYSLGATLYELLALVPAFPGEDRQEVLRRVAAAEPLPPRRLERSVPVDLETVVLRAMAKEPAERYQSARELADDLGRFLEDRPVEARRPTAAQRLRKWAWRRRAVLAPAATVLFLLLTIFAIVLGAALGRETEAHRNTKAAEGEADRRRVEAERAHAEMTLSAALAACDKGDVGRGMLLFARGLEIAAGVDDDLERVFRCNLAAWWRGLDTLDGLVAFDGSPQLVLLAPGGDVLLPTGYNHKARLWRLSTGEPFGPVVEHGHWESHHHRADFHPDGRLLATIPARDAVHLWDTETGQEARPPLAHEGVERVHFSPDGRTLLTTSKDGELRFWDLGSGRSAPGSLRCPGKFTRVRFSHDGRAVMTVSWETIGQAGRGTVRLWDVAGGKPVGGPVEYSLGESFVEGFRPDGQALFIVLRARELQAWDVRAGKVLTRMSFGTPGTSIWALSPDARILLGFSDDLPWRWDVAGGRSVVSFPRAPLGSVAFSPDGRTVLLASGDGVVRRWRAADGEPVGTTFSLPAGGRRPSWSAGGERIAIPSLVVAREMVVPAPSPGLSAGDGPDGPTDDLSARVWRLGDSFRPGRRVLTAESSSGGTLTPDGRAQLQPDPGVGGQPGRAAGRGGPHRRRGGPVGPGRAEAPGTGPETPIRAARAGVPRRRGGPAGGLCGRHGPDVDAIARP